MGDSLVCYTIGYDFVTSSNQYFPCGKSNLTGSTAQACCYGGDYCMEDGICHYVHGGVTNGTGYYAAGCTDKTWQDPACPQACASEYGADIIYNRGGNEWNCCVSTESTLNCQEPSDFTIKAPGPAALSTIQQVMSAPSVALTTAVGSISSQMTATMSSTTGASATSSTSPSSSSTSSSTSTGLSGGAQAGIAIAVIAAAAIISAGAYLSYRKNRRRQHMQELHNSHSLSSHHAPSAAPSVYRNDHLSPTFQHPAQAAHASMGRMSEAHSDMPRSIHQEYAMDEKQAVYQEDEGPFEMQTPEMQAPNQFEHLAPQELQGSERQRVELDASPGPKRSDDSL